MKRGLPARLSFLDFLCETRYQEEQSDPSICSTKFHLGFHLTDKAKSVLITAGTVNKKKLCAAACRAVSNPAWCRIFREISSFSPLNIGTLFRFCVFGLSTQPSNASLDSGENEYLVGQI